MQSIFEKLKEHNEAIEKISTDLKLFFADKDVPLSERWAIFEANYFHLTFNEETCFSGFSYKDEKLVPYDDLYMERKESSASCDVVRNLSDTEFSEEFTDAFKEYILVNSFTHLRYDW
jgi:hypothetical protein